MWLLNLIILVYDSQKEKELTGSYLGTGLGAFCGSGIRLTGSGCFGIDCETGVGGDGLALG